MSYSAETESHSSGAGSRSRIALSYVLAAIVVLTLTIRFPPSDMTGWIAESTRAPLWAVYLALTVVAVVGFLLTLGARRRHGRTGARWMNLILAGGTLLSTIGELLTRN